MQFGRLKKRFANNFKEIDITSKLFIFFTFLLSVVSQIEGLNGLYAQGDKPTNSRDCGIENVTLKTERIEKEHKFLFWSLHRKKVIVTDRIIDSNGDSVFEKKSVFICSMDACDTRKFRRMKIVGNEIWIFSHGRDLDKTDPIKRYDFCGNFLGTKPWENGDYYED